MKTRFRAFCAALLLLAVAPAFAQAYRWVDKDGKVRYSDVPPSGTKSSTLRAPPPAPVAPAAKSAPKAPGDAKDTAAAKDAKEKDPKEIAVARENCERSREQQSILESGQRVTRIDAKGERYFMDDAQRAQEITKAKESVSQWCS